MSLKACLIVALNVNKEVARMTPVFVYLVGEEIPVISVMGESSKIKFCRILKKYFYLISIFVDAVTIRYLY